MSESGNSENSSYVTFLPYLIFIRNKEDGQN